jgi:Cu-processing system ATP-binding protein
MIAIKGIEKSFGKLQILKGINLDLEKGKVYGFLGPNGSGKTTLLKCILGLVKPDEGEISINGSSVINDWKYRENIGYMPQIAQFPENLKVFELFKMIKDVRKQKKDTVELVHYFGLDDSLEKKLKNLSGGMKQKVNAILTLMFDPAILILDEPSVGLDPISHIKLKELILAEREKGKTVLLTTHILSDVEELADEIIFLMDGKIFFKGTKEDLL